MSVRIYIKLFDILIMLILTYNSELRFQTSKTDLLDVNYRFEKFLSETAKYILDVN